LAQPLEALFERLPALHGLDARVEAASEEVGSAWLAYAFEVSDPVYTISLRLAALTRVLCRELRPATVLDFGSGLSSYVFRRYAAESPRPVRVVSVDSSAEWLATTRAFLEGERLSTDGLVTWDEFVAGREHDFDLGLHDLGEMSFRVAGVVEALRRTRRGGLMVVDDAHAPAYAADLDRLLLQHGLDSYDAGPVTRDEMGRYARIVVR
jgi:predicted O-methyltransferase YrrM